MRRHSWRRRAALAVLSTVAVLGSTGPSSGLSRAYICFFDRGSVRITDRCKLIIGETARAWRGAQEWNTANRGRPPGVGSSDRAGQLEVRAYGPDGGGPEASKRLSLLRALAVAAELRAAGVPDELIVPMVFGDETPLVPGAPLDPQNRFAEMVLY